MSELKQSPFSFNQFQIDEFSIRREPSKEGKPEFTFTPSGYIDNIHKSFLLTIHFDVKDSNGAYEINCKCMGYFRFKVEESEKIQLDPFFYLNAPAIIFPYIRSYIASVTALSGLSAINIPLLNFPKLVGEELKDKTFTNDENYEGDVEAN